MTRKIRNVMRISVAGLVIAGAGFLIHARTTRSGNALAAAPLAAPAARAVPVLVVEVGKHDVPVWLDGLGTAAAWRQVMVRSQVEGVLERVLFKEGQRVKRGQLLAQVDPRPFLVQRQQARGALARDEATLKASKQNLTRYRELDKRKHG